MDTWRARFIGTTTTLQELEVELSSCCAAFEPSFIALVAYVSFDFAVTPAK